MIAYITSMRHPANADNYAYNEALLRETLVSISRQSSDEYIVIIVGNQEPSFVLPERVKYVDVNFAPPARANGPHADRNGFVRDKGSKIGIGLVAAREYDPDWVIIFDADDFLHRDVTKFVNAHSEAPGWVIEDGWIYSRARNGYRRQPHFNRTCGTSYVIPYSVYEVPAELRTDSSQDDVVEKFGEILPNIMGAHRNAVQWHKSQGRVLQKLPFAGAVYHVDTGENHSGKSLAGVIRPWSQKFEATYGIASSAGAVETFFSSVGPRALIESCAGLFMRVVRRVTRRRANA